MVIQWLRTSDCSPPHQVTHPEKAAKLEWEFITSGWDTSQPALIGYSYGDTVQLLSGSHRWAAAAAAGIRIPVIVKPYGEVRWSYGNLERWAMLMGSDNV